MSKRIENSKLEPEQEDIYKTVNTVNSQIEILETLISRRFDELSMEINASAQAADMAEDGIAKRFGEILEVIGAINYSGTANSAANSGVELEAVIKDTEQAANNILDAADRITEYVSDDVDWDNKDVRNEMRERIVEDIGQIQMACTFQDLTGQRIRNTLGELQGIEESLNATFETLGIDVEVDKDNVDEKVQEAANQDDIDSLFD